MAAVLASEPADWKVSTWAFRADRAWGLGISVHGARARVQE